MVEDQPESQRFAGRKVLVMGLGVHGGGVGVTRYLVRRGAIVTVTDRAPRELLEASLRQLDDLPVTFVLGRHRQEDFDDCDLIIRNPAVRETSPYLASARRRGTPIETEIGMFWQACRSRRVIAVTGTKGKTTTTRLIEASLRQAGLNPLVAGNLGVSGLDAVDLIGPESWVVLELSSFQLELLSRYRPHPFVAVLTSLYPDHLDVHGTFESYREAKAVLFRYQDASDVAIINGSSAVCREFARHLPARVRFFGPETLPADWSLSILGTHNRGSAGAALLAAEAAGVAPEIARSAISRFPPVCGRLQFLTELNGVRFYNDSVAGNPEATAAALDTLDAPVIWIAGGRDKGLDYTKLGDSVRRKVRIAVLLPGTATDRILECLPTMESILVPSLEQAVVRASELARPGDTVLYSPAADQGLFNLHGDGVGRYRHEDEASDTFREAVMALKD